MVFARRRQPQTYIPILTAFDNFKSVARLPWMRTVESMAGKFGSHTFCRVFLWYALRVSAVEVACPITIRVHTTRGGSRGPANVILKIGVADSQIRSRLIKCVSESGDIELPSTIKIVDRSAMRITERSGGKRLVYQTTIAFGASLNCRSRIKNATMPSASYWFRVKRMIELESIELWLCIR